MRICTTRAWEKKTKQRYSLHLFRWGLHAKIRNTDRWRHGIVKIAYSSAYGISRGKREIWVGWWESHKGVKKQLNGFKLSLAITKLPPHPKPTQRIPVYPIGDGRRKHRERRTETTEE